jgi:hypothetical protein
MPVNGKHLMSGVHDDVSMHLDGVWPVSGLCLALVGRSLLDGLA